MDTYNRIMNAQNPLFNKELMWAIEEDLGEITDVELLPITDHKYYKYQLNYKSNGVLKSDYFGDFKTVISSLYYVGEMNSLVKKYKHLL